LPASRPAGSGPVDRPACTARYFIRRLVGDPDLAEELCQETWLTVIRKIYALENPERFTVWLYRIARNRVHQIQSRLAEIERQLRKMAGKA